jgi:FkbM family methyltransferase|tara:strand:- start:5531 stop:6328 length:798 start_codon:yes stop_codon:yes gene_type:complete
VRVFLDIGAHTGETLDEVLKQKYAFDRVICFEPSQTCMADLSVYVKKDSRVEVHQIGLSNTNGVETLFNPGELNGSIFSEDINLDDAQETITLVDAHAWYANNIDASDFVVIKTNCEGSEVNIIDSFLNGDTFKQFYSLLITFDIRDYPSLAYKEIEARKRLKASGYKNFCFSDDVMIGPTHEKRIENWLSLFGVDIPLESIEDLKKKFDTNFQKFSKKSGNFVRLEIKVKRIFGYQNLPSPIKKILRMVKRIFRMNRERSIDGS